MNVKWTPTAKKQWHKTARHIQKEFGDKTREAFMQEVLQMSLLLGDHPEMGKVEPYLAGLPRAYRSVVVSRLNKIVYYADGNIIYIVAFWDTRREPNAQARQVNDSLE